MESQNAVAMLAALAHEKRLAIFRVLMEHGPNGLTSGEIARAVGIGATATSFHLKEMRSAGLVQRTRQGRHIRYAVLVDAVRGLLTFLTEECCAGHPELCGDAFANSKAFCAHLDRDDPDAA